MDRKKAKEWGSDIIRTRISREPYVLAKRTWKDLQFWEWGFIIVALLSIGLSIGFSIYHLVIALADREKYIFPVLVILNNLFSVYFLLNGVLEELPYTLLIQLFIKTVIWVFDLIYFLTPIELPNGREEDENRVEIRKIRFYISSAMLFLTITSGGLVIYQYSRSKVAIFRAVGTEPKYVRLYRMWNWCEGMIVMDAVVFVTVVFHLFNFPTFVDSYATYYLVPLWLLATVAYVILGFKAVERESRLMTYMFYVASHFQPIFIIVLLVKSTRASLGLLLYISLFVTSAFYVLTHIGQLVAIVRCQNSYGMGLKQAAAREVERQNLMTTSPENKTQKDYDRDEEEIGGNVDRPPATETEL